MTRIQCLASKAELSHQPTLSRPRSLSSFKATDLALSQWRRGALLLWCAAGRRVAVLLSRWVRQAGYEFSVLVGLVFFPVAEIM